MSTEYRNNDTYRGKPKYFGGGGGKTLSSKNPTWTGLRDLWWTERHWDRIVTDESHVRGHECVCAFLYQILFYVY